MWECTRCTPLKVRQLTVRELSQVDPYSVVCVGRKLFTNSLQTVQVLGGYPYVPFSTDGVSSETPYPDRSLRTPVILIRGVRFRSGEKGFSNNVDTEHPPPLTPL